MRLSKSIVGKAEAEAVSRVLIEDGYLGMGAGVGRFEEEIAAYIGIPRERVVCVNSGTAALHLAVEAILQPGDEILVPSFTFLSSFQAISAARATPVACEVYEDTLTLDLEDAERRITGRTRAVMPVHYASNPAHLERTYEFAARHGLRVIEDAAHTFGCTYRSKKIGSFGDVICFSFDGIKNITSGEGGAIISADPLFLQAVKDTRLLGVEKDSDKRYAGQRSWDFDVTRQGYRYHMSNLFAAVGRVQLTRLETEFAPKRRALVKRYRELLGGHALIRIQRPDPDAEIIPHIFPVRIMGNRRDALKEALEAAGIPTGVHYKPNHLLTLYGGGKTSLPVTEAIYHEIVTLPLHPEITTGEVESICSFILKFLAR